MTGTPCSIENEAISYIHKLKEFKHLLCVHSTYIAQRQHSIYIILLCGGYYINSLNRPKSENLIKKNFRFISLFPIFIPID